MDDINTISQFVGTVVAVLSFLNYLLFRFYNGKVRSVCTKLDKLDKKMDEIIEKYEHRISRLEESVKWLIDLTRK